MGREIIVRRSFFKIIVLNVTLILKIFKNVQFHVTFQFHVVGGCMIFMAFNSFTCIFVFDKVADTKSQRYDVYSCINHFFIILFCCRVFGKFGYGFGLPKNSPFTHQFSVKILELRQNGFVDLLVERWFHGVCEKISKESGGT